MLLNVTCVMRPAEAALLSRSNLILTVCAGSAPRVPPRNERGTRLKWKYNEYQCIQLVTRPTELSRGGKQCGYDGLLDCHRQRFKFLV